MDIKQHIAKLILVAVIAFGVIGYGFYKGFLPLSFSGPEAVQPGLEPAPSRSVSRLVGTSTAEIDSASKKHLKPGVPAGLSSQQPEHHQQDTPGPVPSEPEAALDIIEDEEAIYYDALVFRDEMLATFPVYTVKIHKPESISEKEGESDKGHTVVAAPKKSNEIWIRIQPENAREMKEIMAQTADLYRLHVKNSSDNVVVINWVGGQPWARMEFDSQGNQVVE